MSMPRPPLGVSEVSCGGGLSRRYLDLDVVLGDLVVDTQRLVVWQEVAKLVVFDGALLLLSIDHGVHELINAWRLDAWFQLAAVQGDQR